MRLLVYTLYYEYAECEFTLLGIYTNNKLAEEARDKFIAEPMTRSWSYIDNYQIKPVELNKNL